MPIDQHDPFEDRLSAALHQAGGTFDTNRSALAAAGRARGRRLRLRRLAVAGSAAGVALVGAGGAALLLPSDDGARTTASVAASGTPERVSYSADEVVKTLEKLLPRGKFSEQAGRGTHDKLPPSASLVFDDGKGAAAVSVGLDRIRQDTGEDGRAFDPADEVMPCANAGRGLPATLDSCVTEKLPDGSVVTVFQGYEYPDRRAETKLWGADLVTPAGQHVSVSEWNSPAEKGEPVSRPEPPLTTAQLKELAAASQWRAVVDAMPEERRRPSQAETARAPRKAASGAAIRRTLTQLLPEDLRIVSKGAQETEFAYVVVDDGKGESYVQVNVQSGMSDLADQLFGSDAEILADGTRVTTTEKPGEKGGAGVVMWTADTLREDGTRVVISAFNSGSQETAATRPAPALTTAQLREIALSPQWRKLL